MKILNNEDSLAGLQTKKLGLEKVLIPKHELQYLYLKIRDYELLIKQYEDQLKGFMDDKIHQSAL